jgi:hypothetical protein
MLAGLWKPDKGCARAFGLVAKRAVENVESVFPTVQRVERFDGPHWFKDGNASARLSPSLKKRVSSFSQPKSGTTAAEEEVGNLRSSCT